MKRLWIAIGIIVIMSGGALVNVFCLDLMTRDLSATLSLAQTAAEDEDWQRAAQLTQQACDDFDRRSFYLHITLRHEDIDAIEISFQEALQFLTHQEQVGEYTATNARLITQLGLLSEAEQPTLKNIL